MLNGFYLQDIDEFFSKKREWCNTYSKAIKDISNVRLNSLKKTIYIFKASINKSLQLKKSPMQVS